MTSPNTRKAMECAQSTQRDRHPAGQPADELLSHSSGDAPDPYRPLRDPLRFIGVPSRYITRSMKYCPSESVRDSSM